MKIKNTDTDIRLRLLLSKRRHRQSYNKAFKQHFSSIFSERVEDCKKPNWSPIAITFNFQSNALLKLRQVLARRMIIGGHVKHSLAAGKKHFAAGFLSWNALKRETQLYFN